MIKKIYLWLWVIFTITLVQAAEVDKEVFRATWVVPGGGYYQLADQLVMLRHGVQQTWRVIDLSGRQFDNHDDVPTLLQHLPKPQDVKELRLAKAFKKEEQAIDEDAHTALCDIVANKLTGLYLLDVSDNGLGPIASLYGKLIAFGFKGRVRGLEKFIPGLEGRVRSFNFARNKLGGTANDLLGSLEVAIDCIECPNSVLEHFDLSDNGLDQQRSGLLMAIVKKGVGQNSHLRMLNLSENLLTLEDHAQWVAALQDPRQDNPFLLLDLTSNAINEANMKAFMKGYARSIAAQPDQHWPVVFISIRKDDGLYDKPVMIGSWSALKSLEDFSNNSPDVWRKHWRQDINKQKVFYREVFAFRLQKCWSDSQVILDAWLQGYQPAELQAVATNNVAKFLTSAKLVVESRGLPQDIVDSRARLIAFTTPLTTDEKKKRWFKSLCLQEQKHRFLEAFAHLASDPNRHGNLTAQNVLDTTLARSLM